MKKILISALCVIAALPLFLSCTKTESSIKTVESIRIYDTNNKDVTGTTITVNEDFNSQWFTVKFTPSDASDKTFDVDATGGFSDVNCVVWTGDPAANQFIVSFEGNGTSTVTATTTDGKKTASVSFQVSGLKK